jgi:hypothetical protein
MPKERLRIVFLFWLVETLAASLTAARYGSNVNYFLSSYAYGTIIFICGLYTIYNELRSKIVSPFPIWIVFIILFAGGVYMLIPLAKALHSPILDEAAINTAYFNAERRHLADWVNNYDLKCYSDDAGLNILLKKPMILYPRLQNTFFKSGYLDKEFFLDQIKRREFNLIVLTGRTYSYQGVTSFPDEFLLLVNIYYKKNKIFSDSRYLILVPKSLSEMIDN